MGKGLIVIFMLILIMLLIRVTLFVLMKVISYRINLKNKATQFECGFVKVGTTAPAFSIHFFIIVLIFVIFDFEIVLFLGIVTCTAQRVLRVVVLYLFILVGLYIEWYIGKLS